MDINQLLVEGGGEINDAVLRTGWVDEIYTFVAPALLGGRRAVGALQGRGWAHPRLGPRIEKAAVEPVGGDWLLHGFMRRRPWRFPVPAA